MKRAGLVALVAVPLVILGLGILDPARRIESAALDSGERPTALHGLAASKSWLRVLESLVSLSTVQRNLVAAASDSRPTLGEAAADLPPDAELLAAQLATTGLGPIKVGMTVDEVRQSGIDLVAAESGSEGGNCQYYQVKTLVEPIDFMAVDDRIIRIDVWPGSFAETLSGAKIGTSEAELYQMYGDRLEAVERDSGKQLIFTPATPGEDLYRLVFEIDANGTVVQYRAGQFPAVTWPEGCG